MSVVTTIYITSFLDLWGIRIVSPLYKMAWDFYITYTHASIYFKTSLDYLQCLIQCKCYINSCKQCKCLYKLPPVHSKLSFTFGTSQNLCPKYFQSRLLNLRILIPKDTESQLYSLSYSPPHSFFFSHHHELLRNEICKFSISNLKRRVVFQGVTLGQAGKMS